MCLRVSLLLPVPQVTNLELRFLVTIQLSSPAALGLEISSTNVF